MQVDSSIEETRKNLAKLYETMTAERDAFRQTPEYKAWEDKKIAAKGTVPS
ncbi:MAG: hypothetical protein IJA79_01250 [Desulfovibrio sp.]|nr:hypothetical protein [Desulfovibrio sp.]